MTFIAVRFEKFNKLIKSEPRLLYLRGEFLERAMKKERISKNEILQAMRNKGIGGLEEVKAVVLETDGSLSIIKGELEDTLSELGGKTPTSKRSG